MPNTLKAGNKAKKTEISFKINVSETALLQKMTRMMFLGLSIENPAEERGRSETQNVGCCVSVPPAHLYKRNKVSKL